ncbi:hypothetical protein A6R68_15604, partial [Neotoma lepida]
QVIHHTAKLSKLTQELYPAPLECYDQRGLVVVDKFDEVCTELLEIIRSQRTPKTVSICAKQCFKCFHYSMMLPREGLAWEERLPKFSEWCLCFYTSSGSLSLKTRQNGRPGPTHTHAAGKTEAAEERRLDHFYCE